jgi:hypothetical protein
MATEKKKDKMVNNCSQNTQRKIKRLSNTIFFLQFHKNRGRTQVLQKGKQFLLH